MTAALSAGQMAAALARHETDAVSLASRALDRIAATNDDWHVFITVSRSAALTAAAESDERRRAGRSIGPLDGIPVAVKDNIDVAGTPTTNGAGFWRGALADRDALVVERLRDAGAIILGKLNMHEGALGATTDNPFYGRCENPALPGRTPGGSSGGSAAAVAGAIVPIAIGTDTMGSVRIPAAYCGVWGLKPTAGLVSATGLSHLSWTLDTIGPLATTPHDLASALSVMAARDLVDPDGVSSPVGWRPFPQTVSFGGLRLAVPTAVAAVECEGDVRDAFERLTVLARKAGVSVETVVVPDWQPTQARRAGLLVSEAEIGSLIGVDLDRGGDGFSDGFRAMVNFGRKAPGERIAATYRQITVLRHATLGVLGEIDALLMPTAPQRAFAHGTPAPANQADLTALANISGCPAVAFPLAMAGEAPVSVQLVGKPFTEGRILGIADALAALWRKAENRGAAA